MKKMLFLISLILLTTHSFARVEGLRSKEGVKMDYRGYTINGFKEEAPFIGKMIESPISLMGFSRAFYPAYNQNRVAYNPKTGILSTFYNQNSPDYGIYSPIGAWGMWDPSSSSYVFLKKEVQTKSSDASVEKPAARNIQTVMCGDYTFGFYVDLYGMYQSNVKANPMIAVRHTTDDATREATIIETEEGIPPFAWDIDGDVVFDGEKYIALVTMEEGEDKETRDIMFRGTAVDPMGEWEWTKVEEVINGSDDVEVRYSATSVRFAKDENGDPNGFVFVSAFGTLANTGKYEPVFGYTYSTDYGKTWNMKTPGTLDVIPDDGYESGDKNLADNGYSEQFPFVKLGDDSIYNKTAKDSGYFHYATTWGRPELLVTGNNNIHIVTSTAPTTKEDGTLSQYLFYRNSQGVVQEDPGFGFYDLQAHFDGSEIVWKGAELIGNFPGLAHVKPWWEANPGYSYVNWKKMDLAYLGKTASNKDILMCTYPGIQNPEDSIKIADKYPNLDNSAYKYVQDICGVIKNGDEPWTAGTKKESKMLADVIEGTTDTVWIYPRTPHLITVTEEHEMGFSLAENAKNGGDNKYTAYGVVAYPRMDHPLPGIDEPKKFFHYENALNLWEITAKTGAIGDENPFVVKKSFELLQNYPNPFNPSTLIKFRLEGVASVKLRVYNILGEEVCSLINGRLNKGLHNVKFDGSAFNSGVYFYRLNVDGRSITKKMVLTK